MKHIRHFLCVALTGILFIGTAAYSQDEGMPIRKTIQPEMHSVTISNLGDNLNSYTDDFAPILLGSGRVMYFTSGRSGKQDIYSSVKMTNDWTLPQLLGSGMNTRNPEGGATITPDGHWMVFTGCDREDSYGDCDLYMAEYLGGAWRNVSNLGPTVNSESWESQPSISPDGLTIFFASDRPGGRGGTDIWMVTREFGGEWKAPVNLGSSINTPGNEASPCIAIDNKTLFFSSDYLPGIGGMDVYVCKRSGESWSTPKHTGTPINTDADEYFYALQPGTENMYFASDRPGGEGGLDIYLGVPNPFPPGAVTTVAGKVTDATNGTPLGAVITVSDIQSNTPVASFHSDDTDGQYTVILQPGRSYAITAQAPGYLFYSDRFDVPANEPDQTIVKDIKMSKELTRLLVYFDFDKASLQKESNVDLNNAARWLQSHGTLRVELSGHTDNVGSKDYNKKLSDDRANAVRTYLIRRGVAPNRITAVGYGMERPIVPNDTEEGRAKNRRVEFRVISPE